MCPSEIVTALHRPIAFLIFLLPLAGTAFAQARDGCSVVSLTEVTAVLGSGTEQRDASGICIFQSKKGSVTVTLTPNATTSFQVMKLTANQNAATVKEEPGIGTAAFSVVAKDGHGFTIFLLKGTWGAAIGADAGPARIPDVVREKLRALAKKVAGRM
jgi:hypothetical protein